MYTLIVNIIVINSNDNSIYYRHVGDRGDAGHRPPRPGAALHGQGHLCLCIYNIIYIYLPTYPPIHLSIHPSIYYIYIYMYIYIYVYVYINIYVYTYIYVYIYIYIQIYPWQGLDGPGRPPDLPGPEGADRPRGYKRVRVSITV